MTDPWIGIALVVATFAALLAIFSIIGPQLQPEVLRKGLHISMGLTTLSFPWLFEHPWPVVLVAAGAARRRPNPSRIERSRSTFSGLVRKPSMPLSMHCSC